MNTITNLEELIKLDGNEECDVVIMTPYLMVEFTNWLMNRRVIKERTADDYIRAYESAYESLYDIVGVDLYGLLRDFMITIPESTGNNLTKEAAPSLVDIYLETMQEELAQNKDAYSKAELLAMKEYHDFIVEISESNDVKICMEKPAPLPDEEDFLAWLESEYKMDYENANRILSSVKRTNLILPSLVTEPMTFLDVLRAISDKAKRENYIDMVGEKKRQIYTKANCKYKTIQNGLVNIKYYANFLNSKL